MGVFKVTEYWRTGQDDMDFESKEITASTKEEAEKKYWEQNSKTKGFYKLKVEEKGVSESFGRMQELAGLNEYFPHNTDSNLSQYEVEIGIPSGILTVEVSSESDEESALHDAAIDELISEINGSSKVRSFRKLS